MKVLIVGANGKVARQLVKKLSQNDTHEVTAMIRKQEQEGELKELGADRIVLADLEKDIDHAFEGQDCVVFAAGSGPNTGPDKTVIIDLWGARKTVEAAEKHGVKRFVMISSMRSEDPEAGPENMRHYLISKKLADEYLKESSLTYTIIRPGPLSNDEPAGTVLLKEDINEGSEKIARADVAHVIAELLEKENTYNKTFELLGGKTPVEEAVKQL
ncbi:SDR family oxidoreductase [Alteribacillus sp. HJP-4]|uniref:SDR family oxidoreductase n=1 Tax=Alteribacillus sp. HJP-4 TaxID=2775394 RepID=UPI0035CD395F